MFARSQNPTTLSIPYISIPAKAGIQESPIMDPGLRQDTKIKNPQNELSKSRFGKINPFQNHEKFLVNLTNINISPTSSLRGAVGDVAIHPAVLATPSKAGLLRHDVPRNNAIAFNKTFVPSFLRAKTLSMNSFTPNILTEAGWSDYALLDSGNGRKLETFGKIRVSRPEPQALWQPLLPETEWMKADATFTNASEKEEDDKGSWSTSKRLPETWPVQVEGVNMLCRLMTYRHMGLFPEQRPHWQWFKKIIESTSKKPFKVLNLFGYTGATSLIAAKAGAEVTHVDASKKAIQWARENQEASGLNEAKIRWICDDAAKFVAREIRRGNKYDGILLDPPRYGRGPEGEVWKFETDVGPLLASCAELLSDDARFMILTAYTMRLSSLTLQHMMKDAMNNRKGTMDHGELLLADQTKQRPLATSMFCRWSA